MSPGSTVIVRELYIDASPSDVFAYFVDPEKVVTWKAVSAEIDPIPGGRLRMDVTGRGDVAIGSYLEIDPPHKVVFTLGWEGDKETTTSPGVVEVSLLPQGQGTWLRLVHRGFKPAEEAKSTMGWAHYLDRLALVARGDDPGPDPGGAGQRTSQHRQTKVTVGPERDAANLQRLDDEMMNSHDVAFADGGLHPFAAGLARWVLTQIWSRPDSAGASGGRTSTRSSR